MIRVLDGDCREVLTTLADQSVHCVVTSPPYFGLRDYGVDGQIGLESTPDEYVAELVEVFRDVRRVLRDDGTLWLNLGDSYAANRSYQVEQTKGGPKHGPAQAVSGRGQKADDYGIKPKDLIGIPWRVAFALQADGWYLRQDIIWSKPNPMPESVTDRCTKAHEYIFLLTKSPRYFYDAEAIAEPAQDWSIGGPGTGINETQHYGAGNGGNGGLKRIAARYKEGDAPATRNKRSVWTVATLPYAEAHFATFPPTLIEPCIKAGTSEKGCCGKCGAPWVRDVERIDQGWDGSKYGERAIAASNGAVTGGTAKSTLGSGNGKLVGQRETVGWRPTCKCEAAIVPCTVIDPFGGAGTTAVVADRLGRNAILIELNPAYAEMARQRLQGDAGMFAKLAAE